jgi:hypothetical protein
LFTHPQHQRTLLARRPRKQPGTAIAYAISGTVTRDDAARRNPASLGGNSDATEPARHPRADFSSRPTNWLALRVTPETGQCPDDHGRGNRGKSVSSKSSDSDEIGAWMGSPAGYCEDGFEVPIQLLYVRTRHRQHFQGLSCGTG